MNSLHCHTLVHYCSQIIAREAGRHDNPGTDEPLCGLCYHVLFVYMYVTKRVCIEQNVTQIFLCDIVQ